jgi:hypothetical protein
MDDGAAAYITLVVEIIFAIEIIFSKTLLFDDL